MCVYNGRHFLGCSHFWYNITQCSTLPPKTLPKDCPNKTNEVKGGIGLCPNCEKGKVVQPAVKGQEGKEDRKDEEGDDKGRRGYK